MGTGLSRWRRMAALAALAMLGLASRAPAQFDLFHWTLSGNFDGFAAVTADTMSIDAGFQDPVGNVMAWKTRAPVAAHVLCTVSDFPKDGECNASVPVYVINDQVAVVPACFAMKTFSFDVHAGDSFGFGLKTFQATFPGVSFWSDFQFQPTPPLPPWMQLPGGVAGGSGVPVLAGHGLLFSGMPQTIVLTGGPPSGSAALVIGLAALQAPFKGGTLVPMPDVIVMNIPLLGTGGTSLGADWPPGIPSGFTIYMQMWIADGAAVQGFAASNGLSVATP